MNLNISSLSKFVWKSQTVPGYGYQQVRNKWINWMMVRDVKRRRMSAENFLERTRVNAIRKNDILPVEIREIADKEINQFEWNASPMRINHRCVITSSTIMDFWQTACAVARILNTRKKKHVNCRFHKYWVHQLTDQRYLKGYFCKMYNNVQEHPD